MTLLQAPSVSWIDPVLKSQRNVRVTHSIVSLEAADLDARTYSLACEYHVRASNSKPCSAEPQSPCSWAGAGKALGLTFVLPEGAVAVSGVTMNRREVAYLSPLDEISNISNFSLSYWLFPESADTRALGEIFSRLCANRRDLISYEEMTKAHRAASTGQAFGLLVKIPPCAVPASESTISVQMSLTVRDTPLVRQLYAKCDTRYLATLGHEPWFPVPARLMTLPSGVAVTAQPMEHQRHKITIKIREKIFNDDVHVLASGDRIPAGPDWIVFESSWINPRSVGLFVGPFANISQEGVFTALCVPHALSDMQTTLKNEVIQEIVQVLGSWFSSPVQLLPQINLIFLPLPVRKDFFVHGSTIVIETSLLHREKVVDKRINARIVLAEAIASLWVVRNMPAFADVWIPTGIAGMLADRFVEFHLGANEYQYRVLARRQRLHAMVERGLDWKPLSVMADPDDILIKTKATLVIDCLRRSHVGESDMRSAFHELATIASGKKGPWTTDSFFYLLICTVGQHTEAGQALPKFKEEWVKSVGVPLIHIGFSILDKKRFIVSVTQRPLQRISCHDNLPTCSSSANHAQTTSCACGQDFVCRKDEAGGGASYACPHLHWPPTVRRRFWPGQIQLSIYRATNFFVPVPVDMDPESPEGSSQILTVPYVTPRKHELVLNRTARDDELVHGWMTFLDDRWMLAKIVITQSPLMWCNKLQFSRNSLMELSAIEALEHIRGSALVHEVLTDVLVRGGEYFWRVRQEAGRALIHAALGCGEREAMLSVIRWLDSFNKSFDWYSIDPRVFLTWAGVAEQMSYAKRNADRRDHKAISEALMATVKSVEQSLTLHPVVAEWKIDPHTVLALAIRFAIVAAGDNLSTTSPGFKAIDARLRSDQYGPPLASPESLVTEALLSAAPVNGSLVSGCWPHMCEPSFIEKLTMDLSRRTSRTAMRTYLSVVGSTADCAPESEGAWIVRLIWLEKLTGEIIDGHGSVRSVQALSWLVDCWETILERFRRESSKTPLHLAVQRKQSCDRLWNYLTVKVPLLPVCARSHIQHLVHSMYMQAYGTGVPACYRETVDKPRDSKGPLSYWLPFKEHERIYRRFMLRGPTVRPEQPKPQPAKKPRILITGAGSVPLAPPPAFSK